MAEFNLPFGVRIANNDPIDYDRYIATNIATRDAILTVGRAYEGIQIYVESDKTLYILTDAVAPVWDVVGSDSSALADFKEYVDGSLGTRDASIANLVIITDNLDTSIGDLDTLTQTHTTNVAQLDASIVRIDVSLNDAIEAATLFPTFSYVDASLEERDTSISNLEINKLDNTTDTFTGILTIDGSLTISKDLTIDGSVTYINTTNLDVSDNIIYINTGMSGTPPGTMVSGLKINRGDASDYYFIFSEADDTFRVGSETNEGNLPGNTQAVATREDNPTTNGVPYWNNIKNRYDTSIGLVYNGTGQLSVGISRILDSTGSTVIKNDNNTFITAGGTNASLTSPGTGSKGFFAGSTISRVSNTQIALGSFAAGSTYFTISDTGGQSNILDIKGFGGSTTSIFKIGKTGEVYCPSIGDGSTGQVLYYNTLNGKITYDTISTGKDYDASITALYLENNIQDASIERIDASLNDTIEGATLFTSFSYVDGSLATRDGSINYLFNNVLQPFDSLSVTNDGSIGGALKVDSSIYASNIIENGTGGVTIEKIKFDNQRITLSPFYTTYIQAGYSLDTYVDGTKISSLQPGNTTFYHSSDVGTNGGIVIENSADNQQGPKLALIKKRTGQTASDGDRIGTVAAFFYNDAGTPEVKEGGGMYLDLVDVCTGIEDTQLSFKRIENGTLTTYTLDDLIEASLSTLTDVSISDASIYDTLNYDSDTSTWINEQREWYVDSSLIQIVNDDYDVQLNSINVEEDAGEVSLVDMGISSVPAVNTIESYSFDIAGNPVAKIYAKADGAGDASITGFVVEADAQYMGPPDSNGSWRFYPDTDGSLVFERRIAGTWTYKGAFAG